MEEGRDGGRGMDRGRKDGVDMKGWSTSAASAVSATKLVNTSLVMPSCRYTSVLEHSSSD